jgi:hypothetical protein
MKTDKNGNNMPGWMRLKKKGAGYYFGQFNTI